MSGTRSTLASPAAALCFGAALFFAPVLLALAGCSAESAAPTRGEFAGSNVVVTLVDAAAATHMSVYGYGRPTTPFLERLADEAVVFADVTAPAPYTLASVASLMTGEHVDVHRVVVAGDPLPTDLGLLAEGFRDAGYRTLGLSTNAHVHPRFGFDRGFERFEYVDPLVGRTPFHQVPELLLDELATLVSAPDDAPFFAYLHLMPPHAPYDPPPDLRAQFAPGPDAREGQLDFLIALSAGGYVPTDAERQRVVDLYDGGMRYADRVLARVFATLEAADALDDTLWLVLSDHGEAFGEKGIWQHSKLVQEQMLRVPLILRLPGGAGGGTRIAEPVSLVDVFPTLVELFDLDLEPRHTSVTLTPLLAGEALERRPPLVARTAGPGPLTSLRRGEWKAAYRSQSKRWTLHRVAADGTESADVAAEHPEILRELQAEATAWWQRWRPTAAERERVELTDELRAHLEALGYRDLPD